MSFNVKSLLVFRGFTWNHPARVAWRKQEGFASDPLVARCITVAMLTLVVISGFFPVYPVENWVAVGCVQVVLLGPLALVITLPFHRFMGSVREVAHRLEFRVTLFQTVPWTDVQKKSRKVLLSWARDIQEFENQTNKNPLDYDYEQARQALKANYKKFARLGLVPQGPREVVNHAYNELFEEVRRH